tara:strand:- start:810 stop:2018 length:1209 start_codon:yes stop_codon:yes gene_type:complete
MANGQTYSSQLEGASQYSYDDPGYTYPDIPEAVEPEGCADKLKKASLNKKVEILRALVITAEQFEKNIKSGNGGLPFSTDSDGGGGMDLKFIEEFKKIHTLGTDQLNKFVGMINEGSEELDPYSILYYLYQLFNGPYSRATANVRTEEGEEIGIFQPTPDIMGFMGTGRRTKTSAPVWGPFVEGNIAASPLNVPADTYNKCPGFLQSLVVENTGTARGVFAATMQGIVRSDFTGPFINKKNGERMEDEAEKGHNIKPHGNLMVKDVELLWVMNDIACDILDSVEGYLGEDSFRLFEFNKTINYFNKEQNKAESKNDTVERLIEYIKQEFDDSKGDGVGQEILTKEDASVETDLFGNTFDSIDRREFEMNTIGHSGANKFKLYTVKGELGSGTPVKKVPLECK